MINFSQLCMKFTLSIEMSGVIVISTAMGMAMINQKNLLYFRTFFALDSTVNG